MESDSILVRRILTGDQEAFRELMEHYQNYVFTIAFNVLKNREEAEEAAQDVFLKVYRNLGSFKQESRFSTWLYTVAFRTAIDVSRRKQLPTDSIEDDDGHLQLADSGKDNPAEQVQQQDLKDRLATAIRLLPGKDAVIITLFYLQERSVAEIAEITGLTPANIKTKLHRIRERLRIQLSRQLELELNDLM